jgi:hypothetical protein
MKHGYEGIAIGASMLVITLLFIALAKLLL